MTARPQSVSVLGAGSWGTALAVLLARNINCVRLCGRDDAAMTAVARARCNEKYLPGVALPDNLAVASDLKVDADLAFVVAVPSVGFRGCVAALRRCIADAGRDAADAVVVCAGKGFIDGKLPVAAADEVFGGGGGGHGDDDGDGHGDGVRAVISGPSFAAETARGLPTALTVASVDADAAASIADWFRTPTTRVYFSDDPTGVQLGGAIKNVMAIAAGISDGLGFGANARAALITRGLAELTRLGVALGGRADTFAGLTGVGDLILTCTDDQSRNRRFGLGVGRGEPRDQVRATIGRAIEGIDTARELYKISRERGVEMPITEQVYRILFEDGDPKRAVQTLLARDAKSERGR